MYRENILNSKIITINNMFRTLWFEHVFWTRNTIISILNGLNDQEMVVKRLLKNPSDFAGFLKNFYGMRKAQMFQKLLEEHLLIAADLLNAAKAGNTGGVEAARKKWFENADEIADFLADINPYWDKRQWQKMLYEHLTLTEREATERLQGRHENEINTFDMVENQALQMADMMTEGVIEQFNIR